MAKQLTIAMDGAAWLAPFIVSFTRKEWIKEQMKGIAFAHHPDNIRLEMFGQVYDLAKKSMPKQEKEDQ